MTKLNEIRCEMRLQRMHVPTLDPRIVINHLRDKDRQRFSFVRIFQDGTFTFSSTFLSAHDAADQAAEARRKADGR